MKLHPLCFCGLALLVCSCAATKVKTSWKSPQCHGPVGKMAVLTIEERPLLREGFENRFVNQLKSAGDSAFSTFGLLSYSDIKADKKAAAERLITEGAQALIVLRLVDSTSSYRVSQPGGEHYVGTVDDVGMVDWYGYVSVGFMDMSPTYGNLNRRIYLETSLFDLKTEKRIWVGVTETTIKDGMDAVAEMDPLVAKILTSMRTDGVIH
jgi:hypothetical protein